MTVKRMDNVSIVFEDLDAAVAFFIELGLELEGRMRIEGRWAERVVGVDDMSSEIAMMRTPDGGGRLELTTYHRPAARSAGLETAPANTLGMYRLMFAVDDVDDTIARLQHHGAALVGDVVNYENVYRLCYLRGPEGIILALAEELRRGDRA